MVISEARLARDSKGLIWGIAGASTIVIVISAQAGGILLPGLLIAAGIVALTWLILRMTVSIAITDEKIVLRCEPFYLTAIPLSDLSAVTRAPDTSLSEGYGIRVLGRNIRGVLVGGPAVALETASRRWIISAADPEEVLAIIQAQIATT
ncbi:hypothetical protein [Arthrobacter sp. MMS18-M83]|uniref:hypothetical protein n=1 Tax=Arthrobacter sp. MMS18-M83 TaxID=2996261 RepID=UPI00227ABE5E|nr:hypothetical protein [Arthrobacter sp. MMS18-M83]WAH98849.1 hypothetical protein OW521_08475 [Arthrobacter sp. MMS18-M83]